MPKQIDIKVTTGKPQNKHGYGTTRKCPIGTTYSSYTVQDSSLFEWYLSKYYKPI